MIDFDVVRALAASAAALAITKVRTRMLPAGWGWELYSLAAAGAVGMATVMGWGQ